MNLIFKIIILYGLIFILNCSEHFSDSVVNESKVDDLNGVYIIKNSLMNELYFSVENNTLLLSKIKSDFKIIPKGRNKYLMISKILDKKIGIDEFDNIMLYDNNDTNITKIYWNFIKINLNQYLIQNIHNQKYLMINNSTILFCNNTLYINLEQNFIFNFIKLYEEAELNQEYLEIIEKEPIDVLIKYIDLTDNTSNRTGIIQIYKDHDNEELRFSIRSILENIPWIRKIYILMHGDWAQSPIPIFHK